MQHNTANTVQWGLVGGPLRLFVGRGGRSRAFASAAKIAFLLAVATVGDYLTGPAVMSTGFYFFAVMLAAWWEGLTAGLCVALLAAGLDIGADVVHPANPLAREFLPVNWYLDLLVFLGTAWLSATASRQAALIVQQRDRLAEFSAQVEEEMRAARELQQLLGGAVPELPTVEIGTYLQPARFLGGDAVDLSLAPDGPLAILIADVSGKGSPAALASAVLIGILDDAPERFRSPAGTLRYLNQHLVERLPGSMFVTVFYALLDPERGRLTYASAGHDPPLLLRVRDSGATTVEELLPTGIVLAVLPEAEFEERTEFLRPGDVLFCYTDGITDVQDLEGTRLGPDRLRDLVVSLAEEPARETVQAVVQQVTDNASCVPDDISLVVLRYRAGADLNGEPQPSDAPGDGASEDWR